MKIVDLHTHSIFSDGVLVPSELAQRAKHAGYSGIAITDHMDFSNYTLVIKAINEFKEKYNRSSEHFKILSGGEITHVPPVGIAELAQKMYDAGADLVVVHGETIMEPVEKGTNKAAILAGVDILAHPGLITEEDVKLAVKHNVMLEITTRKGHSYTNGHVAALARKHGAKLVVNNDAHEPSDFAGAEKALKILQGAGLSIVDAENVIKNTIDFFELKLREFQKSREL